MALYEFVKHDIKLL